MTRVAAQKTFEIKRLPDGEIDFETLKRECSDRFRVTDEAFVELFKYVVGVDVQADTDVTALRMYKTVVTDSGTATADSNADALSLVGGEGVDTSSAADTITITAELATSSNKGVASFSSAHFTVTTGAVAIAADGIDDTLIDWGVGANQVNLDDVPDGSSYERVAAAELAAGIYKDATDAVKGISKFQVGDFTVTSGDVSLAPFRAEWNQNGFENLTDSTLTWTDSGPNYTLSVQPTGTNFSYWVAGVKHTSTGDTVQIDNTKEGIHAIYYDGATLTATANPSAANVGDYILTKALVSFVYWDTSGVTAIYVGEERHGKSVSSAEHNYHHFIDGLRYVAGLGLNTIAADGAGATADAQFGTDAGGVVDEDLPINITAVTSTTGLPIHSMLGADADWQKHTEAGFGMRTFDGTDATRLAWNEYTGGAWQLTQAGNNEYVLCHVVASTEKDKPMLSVMGQAVYATKKLARAGALTEIKSLVFDDVLFPEIRAIATVIFQTNLSYASAINARIVTTDEGDDYVDWRSELISRTEITTTDHNSLTGKQGGTVNEYYHTTSAEHTENTRDATNAQNGLMPTAKLDEWDAAYTHIGESGASHTYIDQDVQSTASPSFVAITASTGAITATSGDISAKDAGKVYAYSLGDDKNISMYHNDTNGFVETSAGTLALTGNTSLIARAGTGHGIQLTSGVGCTIRDANDGDAIRWTCAAATGLVTMTGNLIIPDAGYIGSASDTDAIQIEADGDVVLTQDLAVTGTFESTGVATLADASVTKTTAAPTADAQIANKKYVDDEVGGVGGVLEAVFIDTYEGNDANNREIDLGDDYQEVHIYLEESKDYLTNSLSLAWAVGTAYGVQATSATPDATRAWSMAAGNDRFQGKMTGADATKIKLGALGTSDQGTNQSGWTYRVIAKKYSAVQTF